MKTRLTGSTPLLASLALHVGACMVIAPWVAAREHATPQTLVPIQLVSMTEPVAPPPPPKPVAKRPPPRKEPIVPPRLISRPEIEEVAPPPAPTPVVEPEPAPVVAATPTPPAPPAAGAGAGTKGGGIVPPRRDGGGIALPVGDGGGVGSGGIGAGGTGTGMLASTGSGGLTSFARPKGGYQTRPRYPEAARRAGIEGITTLRFEVRADGTVGAMSVEKSAGYAALDQAAMLAVRLWRFEPARRGSEAVSVWVTLPVRFELSTAQ